MKSFTTGILAKMKNILITGVSTGLGYHACSYLLNKGYRVLGSVRKQEDAQSLRDEFGPNFTPLVFDVTDTQAVKAAIPVVREVVGTEGLYALVNNAGIAVSGPIKHVPLARLETQLQVNVIALVAVTQCFLPLLGGDRDSSFPPGRIINISSVSGLIANPFMGPYAASKHAVEALSDVMRREFNMYGIKVVCVEPGIIKTDIWQKAKSEPRNYGKTDYDDILARQGKIIDGMESRGLPPVAVSRVIEKALTRKNPATRYIVANKAWLYKLFAHIVPDKWLDSIIAKNISKDNIRSS